ncbi:hypothetical protein J6590_018771 [Homalodisca vitripennis]|nr:hypothetical protein J6590_018771 [Homalodisca vitripennis]
MGDTPEQEKKPIENGLSNESEDSGNTSEQEPCLPTDLKGKEMDMTDTLDSKHLDTEMMKPNKKRHNVNKKPHVSVWVTISNSFSASVKYLMDKTGLSKIGVTVAVVFLLLFIVCCVTLLVLGILWPKIPHELKFPICRRSACLRSSSEFLTQEVGKWEKLYNFLVNLNDNPAYVGAARVRCDTRRHGCWLFRSIAHVMNVSLYSSFDVGVSSPVLGVFYCAAHCCG